MYVNEATLTELVNRARQRGSISMEDLRKALPIDGMTVEEISDVLVRLEEAGFDVDTDPHLLSPKRRVAPLDVTTLSKPGQAETPAEAKRQSTSSPTSTDGPLKKPHTARRPRDLVSAPMLPWVVALVIVVLAVFAAFAF